MDSGRQDSTEILTWGEFCISCPFFQVPNLLWTALLSLGLNEFLPGFGLFGGTRRFF